MRRKRNLILLSILFLSIGFAAVTTTLVINGTLKIGTNQNDFDRNVIFTRAEADSESRASISVDGKTITFTSRELKNIYEEAVLDFDVTNKSRQYGVQAVVECTKVEENNPFNDYITLRIEPEEFTLGINETMSGKLTTTMIRSFVGTEESETADIAINCRITANAVEVEAKDDDNYEPTPSNPNNTISGYLVDENNNVLANKNIVIYSEDETYFATTDENGYFAINGMAPGEYEILIVEGKTMEEIKNMTIEEIKNQASIKGNYDTTDNNLTFENEISVVKKEPQEITFDTSGLDMTIPPIKVVEGQPFGSLPTLEKEGYTFEGWYLGDELILPTTIVSLKDGQVLRPKFTLTNYTVTLVNNTGGNISAPTISLNYGGTNTFTVTPSGGYYLSGVSCTNGYTTNARVGTDQTASQTITVSNNNREMASSCTITYTPTNYTITSNYASGTGNNPTSYNITSNSITLGIPTRTGYTFAGWTGSNGSTPQITVTIPKGSTGNKSYTANWTVNSYTATIGHTCPNCVDKSSGGTISSTSLSLNYGGTKTFTVTPGSGYYLSRVSCTNGYTTNAKVGTAQTASQTITVSNNNREMASSCTVTFDLVVYTITYNMNGGTGYSGNPTSYNVEWGDIDLGGGSRSGYTFAGWTGSNGTTPQTRVYLKKGRIGNRTYNANWNLINYSITYNLGGGTNYASNPTSYNITSNNISLGPPSRTGYTFAGWTGTNGTTPQINVAIPNGSTGAKSYTANWRAKEYIVNIKESLGGTLKWNDTNGQEARQFGQVRVSYSSSAQYTLKTSTTNRKVSVVSCTTGYSATVSGNVVTVSNNGKESSSATCEFRISD